MNTFNRKTLYAALAGLGAIGATGAVEAVNLNPDGLGQVLIYPYYTVRSNAAGAAYNTLISVVNTTASAKAVKVRFVEGKNSKEVLDFNLFLSGHDVWTAAVVATATGAGVTSDDKSCILPSQLPKNGQPPQLFVNFAYSSDTTILSDGTKVAGDTTLDRTREGYVEIIEMARYWDTSTTSINVTHVGGTPYACGDMTDAIAAESPITGNGGLFGGVTLINVQEGSAYSQDATALDNFATNGDIYFNAGSASPSLADVNPAVSVVIANGAAVITDWTVAPNLSLDAVSAVLMHDSVLNEYSTDPGVLANTDWVVTMPTKSTGSSPYVKVGTGAAIHPFQRNFNGTAGACDDVSVKTWDREEKSPSTPGGFSPPPPPGKASSLCWEANVLTFQANGILGSVNSKLVGGIGANNQINGWAKLTFVYSNATLIGGATTQVTLGVNGTSTSNFTSATYAGLPVVGFAVQSYNNNLIVVNGKNIQSTYGADFAHRFTTKVTPGLVP